jgi:hypothetical protein
MDERREKKERGKSDYMHAHKSICPAMLEITDFHYYY